MLGGRVETATAPDRAAPPAPRRHAPTGSALPNTPAGACDAQRPRHALARRARRARPSTESDARARGVWQDHRHRLLATSHKCHAEARRGHLRSRRAAQHLARALRLRTSRPPPRALQRPPAHIGRAAFSGAARLGCARARPRPRRPRSRPIGLSPRGAGSPRPTRHPLPLAAFRPGSQSALQRPSSARRAGVRAHRAESSRRRTFEEGIPRPLNAATRVECRRQRGPWDLRTQQLHGRP